MLKINNQSQNTAQAFLQARKNTITSIPSKSLNININLLPFQAALALKAATLTNISFTGKDTKSELLQNKIKEIVENDKLRDIPVIEKIDSNFIETISDKISKNPNIPMLIGLTGASASGKTTVTNIIANKIKDKFGESSESTEMIPVTIINGDNYYYGIADKVTEAGGIMEFLKKPENDLNSPEDVNLERIKTDLISLKAGQETSLPIYSFSTFKSDPEGIKQKPARCVISEGIFALHDEVRNILDVKIFIDTPEDIIKSRWYERAPERGFTDKASQDNVFTKVDNRKKEYIEPTKADADIVINGHSKQKDIELVTNDICTAIQEIIKQDSC